MTLHDVAADLRAQAAALQTTASDLLAQATVIDPDNYTGYVGPTTPSAWTAMFSDDFSNATLGQLTTPGSSGPWGCYPTSYLSTDHGGIYDPANATVVAQSDGRRIVHLQGQPASQRSDGKIAAATIYPQVSGAVVQSAVGMRVEFRKRQVLPASVVNGKWHDTNMFFCIPSSAWPGNGEIDAFEQNVDPTNTSVNIKSFFHNEGATTGSDQQSYTSPTAYDLTQWHTYAVEWMAGTSIKTFVDGVQLANITSRVPNHLMRWLFQFESVGAPEAPAAVELDWVTVWYPHS